MRNKVVFKKQITVLLALILSPFFGFIAFLLPILFIEGMEVGGKENSIVSIVSYIFEECIFVPTIVLLFVSGFILGRMGPRIWWLLGLLTMLIFPVAASYEMQSSLTSHNLWPFEFLFFGFFTIPAIIGAYFSSRRKMK